MRARTFPELFQALINLGFDAEKLGKARRVYEDSDGTVHADTCPEGEIPHIYGFDRIMKHAHSCIITEYVSTLALWAREAIILDGFDALEEKSPTVSGEVQRYLRIRHAADAAQNGQYGSTAGDDKETIAGYNGGFLKVADWILGDLVTHRIEASEEFDCTEWVLIYSSSPNWSSLAAAEWRLERDALVTGIIPTENHLVAYVPYEVASNLVRSYNMDASDTRYEVIHLNEDASYEEAAKKVRELSTNLKAGTILTGFLNRAFAA